MPVDVTKLKLGVDLPVFQWMNFNPFSSQYHGTTMAYDGTRFMYMFVNQNSGSSSSSYFVRYDCITNAWQFIGSTPVAYYYGAELEYDQSRDIVWAIMGNATNPFYGFNAKTTAQTIGAASVNPLSWSAALAVVPTSVGYGGSLVHTDTTRNAGGNDDFVYCIPGNNSTTFYRYSISANTWTTMAALPGGVSNGGQVCWPDGYDTNKLYALRGNTTSTIYVYNISLNTWSTLTYYPSGEPYTTGSYMCYDKNHGRLWMLRDNTQRLMYLDLASNIMYPGGTIPYATTAGYESNRMQVANFAGLDFLYIGRGGGSEFYRAPIFW